MAEQQQEHADDQPDDKKGGPDPDKKQPDQKDDGKKDEDKKDEDKKDDKKPEKRRPLWPLLLGGVVVLVFVAVVLAIIFVPDPDVWTDDAYVTAHYATIAPRVSGQVVSVAVDDNQPVKAGQVLATLDDRDFRTRVEQAEAQLARDQAALADRIATVQRQPDLIGQQDSSVEQIRARIALAQANATRYRNLAATGSGSQQDRQTADSTLRSEQAELTGALASAQASRHQLDVLKAQQQSALATLKADRAQLDQARLDLSYTRLYAPVDGMVGERTVQLGNIVSPGTALMVVAPLGQAYIEAHYRELALKHMLPGQHVRIHVDAYDMVLDGIVDSVPPASGAVFSPVAPDNATGNFTKIVQRLPVKIVLAPNQPLARLLRLGLSVETTVHTGFANVRADQAGSTAPVTAH